MNRFPGRALMATRIGHALLGLVLFREPLAAVVRDGIANTIRTASGGLSAPSADFILDGDDIARGLG
jgi:hypothetical protein